MKFQSIRVGHEFAEVLQQPFVFTRGYDSRIHVKVCLLLILFLILVLALLIAQERFLVLVTSSEANIQNLSNKEVRILCLSVHECLSGNSVKLFVVNDTSLKKISDPWTGEVDK